MGFINDLSKWLSGGRVKKDNIRSASIKLKLHNRRLQKQVMKLDMTAKRSLENAKKYRREGDEIKSKFHAKTYLQIKNQSRAIDMFRSNLEMLQFKMENAAALKDVEGIFKNIAGSVANLKNQMSIPQLTTLMNSIDMDVDEFEVVQDFATESTSGIATDVNVTDGDVDNVLGEIDAELQVETGGALPSAAVGDPQKVKELEDELNRLRSND